MWEQMLPGSNVPDQVQWVLTRPDVILALIARWQHDLRELK